MFILTCIARTLPARESSGSLRAPPCSTATLQRYFHRHPGLSLIFSCRCSPKSPAVGHPPSLDLYRALKHRLGNLWMGSPSSPGALRTQPGASGASPGVQGGCCEQHPWFAPVLNAPEMGFSGLKPGFTAQDMGAAHTRATPETCPSAASPDAVTEADLLPKYTTKKGPIINEPSSPLLNCTGSSPSHGSSNPHHPPRPGDAGPSPRVISAIYPQADIHHPIPPESERIHSPKFNGMGKPQTPVNGGIGESSWRDYSMAKKKKKPTQNIWSSRVNIQ